MVKAHPTPKSTHCTRTNIHHTYTRNQSYLYN